MHTHAQCCCLHIKHASFLNALHTVQSLGQIHRVPLNAPGMVGVSSR